MRQLELIINHAMVWTKNEVQVHMGGLCQHKWFRAMHIVFRPDLCIVHKEKWEVWQVVVGIGCCCSYNTYILYNPLMILFRMARSKIWTVSIMHLESIIELEWFLTSRVTGLKFHEFLYHCIILVPQFRQSDASFSSQRTGV